MPSNDDLLFGEHAVRGGFLSREEVDETLAVQRRMEEMGVRDTLRNVLVNRGALREGDAAIITRAAGLAPGREPIPGYTLESRLGTGAMGSVYKAWQKGMQRHVAVKILRRDLTSDARQVERLHREAALVGNLDHSAIVRGLDSGESEGLVWFAMEYVEGETLLARIRRGGPMPHDEALRVTERLAEALVHAHSKGVVHRDIKPGNVLLDLAGSPRLADYGLAKGQSDDALTQIDATLGTPQYVAPEQARNPRDADIQSDIYSLGATLYTMLCGRPPFEGETLAQTLTKVLYERPRPLRELAPQTPPAVAYIVERMIARDRRHRYATPQALLHDLRQARVGKLAVPSGFDGDLGAFVQKRRQRRMWLTGAAIVVAAVSASFATQAWERRENDRRIDASAEAAYRSAADAAGPRAQWTGATVAEQLRRLTEVSTTYAGSRAADDADRALVAWRRQAAGLTELQDLTRSTEPAGGAEPDWARAAEAMEALRRRLAADPDMSVARVRAEEQLVGIRDRRDRRARLEIDSLLELPESTSLRDAALLWDAKARLVSERFYGGAAAQAVSETRQISEDFARAAALIERHWAAYAALSLRGSAASDDLDLANAEAVLAKAAQAARGDEALRELLAKLPPRGRFSSAVSAAETSARALLASTADRRFAAVTAAAKRLAEAREYGDATAILDRFLERAGTANRAAAMEQRRAIIEASSHAGAAMKMEVSDAFARFLAAYGRRDPEQARLVLSDLAKVAQANPVEDGGAARFAVSARKLTDLTEELLWRRVQANLSAYATAGGGLTDVRTRIRYAPVADARAEADELRFSYGGGQVWRGPVAQIDVDDLIKIAALTRDVPEEALVSAAMRLARYQIPSDPASGVQMLADLGPYLDAARRVEGVGPVVDELSRERDLRLVATRRQIEDAEQSAEAEHRAALESIARGQHGAAGQRLRQLMDTRRLRTTEYITRRLAEIRQQIDACDRAVAALGFASRFPGARWTDLPDGTAELSWDFEGAGLALGEPGARVLALVPGRTAVASKVLPVYTEPSAAARPARELPLRLDHVLEWAAEDESGSPRDAPVRIANPFLTRKRIEVSFLYRSDRPVFFATAIGGAAAGVLSLPEKFGGRGTIVWGAAELTRPDLAFDDKFRSAWIDAHPDLVRREEATKYFQFEPGRAYRIRVIRDDRRTTLMVDGRIRAEGDVKPPTSSLADQIVLSSFGPAEIEALRITGTPDPDWAKRR